MKTQPLKRREFLKTGLKWGAVAVTAPLFSWPQLLQADPAIQYPDLVAIKNGEPEAMFDRAIEAMGGIQRFVRKGQTVIVKPNIGWAREPETGANTHPGLVRRIIEHCLQAGARKVYVFDNTCNNWKACYQQSQIEAMAKAAGATVAPAHDERYYQEITIPGAVTLKKVKVHELIPDCDVFINVPVLKHHGSTRLTIAMKNLMGAVWDRGYYHHRGLHQCIADFGLYCKPTLNVVDAYRVTTANGPQRARPEDVKLMRALLISSDMVAIDAAAAKLFGSDPQTIDYIVMGQAHKLGEMNLERLNIQRLTL